MCLMQPQTLRFHSVISLLFGLHFRISAASLSQSHLIFSQRLAKPCYAGPCFVVMLSSRRQTLSCPSIPTRFLSLPPTLNSCTPPLLLRFLISSTAFPLLHPRSPCLRLSLSARRRRLLSWLRALNHPQLQTPLATPVRLDPITLLSALRTHLLLRLPVLSLSSPVANHLAPSSPRRPYRSAVRLRILSSQKLLQILLRATFPLLLPLPMFAQIRRPRLRPRLWRLHQLPRL